MKDIPAFLTKEYSDQNVVRVQPSSPSPLPGLMRIVGWIQIAACVLWLAMALMEKEPWLAWAAGLGGLVSAVWWFAAALGLELLERIANRGSQR